MAIVRTPKLSPDAESVLSYLLTASDAMDRHKRRIKSACHLTDTARAELAFNELFNEHHILDAGEGLIDLTSTGRELAQSLKKPKPAPRRVTNITNHIGTVENGHVSLTGAVENGVLATPLNYESLLQAPKTTGSLAAVPYKQAAFDEPEIERTRRNIGPEVPDLTSHPLRVGLPDTSAPRAAKPAPARNVSVRFMLAFDQPKNALPIPLVHGDIVGRSKKNTQITLLLNFDEYVSNKHCRFEVVREKGTNRPMLFVEDLGSRNGTFVDDFDASDGKMQLLHGSRLRIGSSTFVVVEIPY